MQRRTLFFIVPEGWLVLVTLAAVFLIINAAVGFWAACPVLAMIALGAVYFRDAPRDVPAEPLAVIAPVDGTVVYRREGYDPYLDREAIKIALRVHMFGVYLLRSPAEGTVLELSGAAVARQGGVASLIRTDEGDALIVAVRRGSLLGAQPCQSSYGERVGQGRRCGMRRLARQVEIYLPINSRVEVELGDSVRAGAGVLAKLVHKPNSGRMPENSMPGAA